MDLALRPETDIFVNHSGSSTSMFWDSVSSPILPTSFTLLIPFHIYQYMSISDIDRVDPFLEDVDCHARSKFAFAFLGPPLVLTFNCVRRRVVYFSWLASCGRLDVSCGEVRSGGSQLKKMCFYLRQCRKWDITAIISKSSKDKWSNLYVYVQTFHRRHTDTNPKLTTSHN